MSQSDTDNGHAYNMPAQEHPLPAIRLKQAHWYVLITQIAHAFPVSVLWRVVPSGLHDCGRGC